jgi:hypothetical protein
MSQEEPLNNLRQHRNNHGRVEYALMVVAFAWAVASSVTSGGLTTRSSISSSASASSLLFASIHAGSSQVPLIRRNDIDMVDLGLGDDHATFQPVREESSFDLPSEDAQEEGDEAEDEQDGIYEDSDYDSENDYDSAYDSDEDGWMSEDEYEDEGAYESEDEFCDCVCICEDD